MRSSLPAFFRSSASLSEAALLASFTSTGVHPRSLWMLKCELLLIRFIAAKSVALERHLLASQCQNLVPIYSGYSKSAAQLPRHGCITNHKGIWWCQGICNSQTEKSTEQSWPSSLCHCFCNRKALLSIQATASLPIRAGWNPESQLSITSAHDRGLCVSSS